MGPRFESTALGSATRQAAGVRWQGAVIQAPMAGFTDRAMRRMAREFGADIVYTEMVSARALVEGHPRTAAMLDGIEEETGVVVQLMGSDPGVMAEAATVAESRGADGVDINLGCAVKKIVQSGAGAALLRDPLRVREILRRVREAVRIPVSAKIRAGWDQESRNAEEIGRMVEGEGADAVAIHGRLAVQGFGGRADWSVVRRLAETLTVPVIGNGDVECWEDAEGRMRETGCAAVMIGRGALGRPWVFREVKAGRGGSPTEPPCPEERIGAARRHLLLAVEAKGRRGLLEMRKHLAWYLRGLPCARETRRRIHGIETVEGVTAELEGLLGERRDGGNDGARGGGRTLTGGA